MLMLKNVLDQANAEVTEKDGAFTLRLTHSAAMLPLMMVAQAFMVLEKESFDKRPSEGERVYYPFYTQWIHSTVKAGSPVRSADGTIRRKVVVSGVITLITAYTIDSLLAYEIAESTCELKLHGKSWVPFSTELNLVTSIEDENDPREVETHQFICFPIGPTSFTSIEQK